jgi:hypothetical protein
MTYRDQFDSFILAAYLDRPKRFCYFTGRFRTFSIT